MNIVQRVNFKQNKEKTKICTNTHDYVTPHQISKIYRMALKNSFLNRSMSALLCVCSTNAQRTNFVRILIILDWLRQNVIDKTPPTSKQKQLVCWRTGGKIFLDRPPSKRKLWQNISRSPTKRWSSSANALPATSVWSLKCKMKLRWKSMKRF